jgi:Tfp pilus assembly protein PilF
MEKNKNLTIEETLNLAIKNHQEGKTDIALNLYNKILEIDPNHSQALNNLAVIFTNLKENHI